MRKTKSSRTWSINPSINERAEFNWFLFEILVVMIVVRNEVRSWNNRTKLINVTKSAETEFLFLFYRWHSRSTTLSFEVHWAPAIEENLGPSSFDWRVLFELFSGNSTNANGEVFQRFFLNEKKKHFTFFNNSKLESIFMDDQSGNNLIWREIHFAQIPNLQKSNQRLTTFSVLFLLSFLRPSFQVVSSETN